MKIREKSSQNTKHLLVTYKLVRRFNMIDILSIVPDKTPRCDCWAGTSGFKQTAVSWVV